MFRQQLPADLAMLVQSHRQGDARQIGFIAHRIRGAEANAGLGEIARLCAQIEEEIEGNNPDSVAPLLERLYQTEKTEGNGFEYQISHSPSARLRAEEPFAERP